MMTHLLPQEMRDPIEAYDREAWDILKPFVDDVDGKEPPKVIFHYTDDVGLHGIIQSGVLRLTDIFRLNDPSEIKHGFSHAVKILKDRAANASEEAKRFAENFQHFVAGETIEESAHFFACCFSGDGDELGQWRAYADNGRGFALGFDTHVLEQAFVKPIERKDGGPLLPSTFRVIYDDDRLLKIQSQLLDKMFPLIALPVASPSMHPIAKSAFWKELSVRHAVNVVSGVLFFKHKAYKNEDEYRFLQLFRRDRPAPDTKFKTRPYSLVRYREFDWRGVARGSLKRIVIGPAADRAKSTQFVRDCLEAFDSRASEIEITHSCIPYRTA